MERSLLAETSNNGGFPEPPDSEPVRVVAATHDACGQATRVRLPEVVPPRVVRRMHCSSCDQAFETDLIEELEEIMSAPAPAPTASSEFSLPEFELPMFDDLRLPGTAEVEPDPVAPQPIPPAPEPVVEPDPVVAPAPVVEEEPEELLEGVVMGLPEEVLGSVEYAHEEPKRRALPEIKLPKTKLPEFRLPRFDHDSPVFKLAGYALAIVAVIALLGVIQGGDPIAPPALPAAPEAKAPSSAALTSAAEVDNGRPDVYLQGSGAGAGSDAVSTPSKESKLVRGSTYSLALPAGWQRIDSAGGAAFAAASADGGADAQLWISEDAKLDFPTFINQSLAQLESLAGSAQIVERVPGPTPETTIVRLAADAPADQPGYEVTLRAAGPYRYYLATTIQPDASSKALEGVDLITGSFTPEAGN